ncbi:MAG: hypothetical protein LBV38_02255 [Alistipes sp.]|jgi:hypothetical protein|nr:hypothetical protein [Alistipes sp.]
MKKIFALLLGALSICSVSAQGEITEPHLPPMENFGSTRADAPHTPPILRMRGVNIDDGYGELSHYGAAMLFGGTPSHDDYMNGIRHLRVSAYTLWPGVALSVLGILTMTSAIGVKDDWSGLARKYRTSVVGAGGAMLAVGASATVVGVIFRGKAKRSLSRAVDIYNEHTRASLHNSRAPELSFGFTRGGVGLSYDF